MKSRFTPLRWFFSTAACLVVVTTTLHAEVKLNPIFGDGMVLQQGVEVPIWGTARDGEKITVKFQKQSVTTTASNGRWMVHLKSLKAGGPFSLTISGDNTITLQDVLIGEVWLASGQSNMAFALSRAHNAREAIPAAVDPQLRLFTVARGANDQPQTEVSGNWTKCTPETAANFSAVAYFFGRDLRSSLKIPIGLIHSSVGGTPAEAWVSRATLEKDPVLKEILDKYAQSIKTFDTAKQKAAASKKKLNPKTNPDPRETPRRPNGLYNAMIAPLQPYAIAGVIWYQGEANSGRAAEYQTLFPALIQNWRDAWHKKDLPFFFVQIAPENRMTPEIREAQFLTMQKVPRTGMAVTVDVGDANDIHPTRKEPVGHRLALTARAIAYGEKVEFSGPLYKSLRIDGDKAVVSFKHVGGGLVAEGGILKGFTVAGTDGQFHPADARIDKDRVVVTSSAVPKPVAVRYGWANVPDVNLFNKEGLPASPFRTDVK